MKLYKSWTMVLALAGAMAAPLYGCSSDDVDTSKKSTNKDKDAGDDDKGGEGGNAGEDGDDGEGGQGGEGGNDGTGGNGDTDPTNETCAEMSNEQACVDCCDDLHPEGSEIFNAAIEEFFCGTSGVCKTECATTLCQGQKQVDQGCYDCYNANQAGAQTHLQAVCGQSQECVTYNNDCLLGCQ